jgi:hypothetical protein
MTEYITSILKNLGCSQCQEFEFENSKEYSNYWKLYLKEYEMYSAMVLYHDNLKNKISTSFSKNDSIILFDEDDKVYIKLEYISINEEDGNAILVPTDEYQELYQNIEGMTKKYDKALKAYYIGTYKIKKAAK